MRPGFQTPTVTPLATKTCKTCSRQTDVNGIVYGGKAKGTGGICWPCLTERG